MAYVSVRHRVKDYPTWKSTFDAFIENRKAGGEKTYQILHPVDDPNNLVLIFEWDTAENAQTFLSSPQLREAMGEAGVLEAPEIYILEEVARGVTA
ncbi:MAG: antibiotic biosynthesis monooxygenase [Anaerolineae bacterium]